MAAMPCVKLGFTTPYKGGTKNWSIKLHLSGGTPANNTAFQNLYSDIWTHLGPGMRSDQALVLANWYPNDTSPALFTDVVTGVNGSLTSGGDPQAAYMAALLSWTTLARNSRGGPVYLRNFIHGAVADSTDKDALWATQKTALAAFAARCQDSAAGFSDGTNTYFRVGPNGAHGIVGTARDFLSHRVLARRG